LYCNWTHGLNRNPNHDSGSCGAKIQTWDDATGPLKTTVRIITLAGDLNTTTDSSNRRDDA
jgi:hypothetical protein